jgi:hypothetical protein
LLFCALENARSDIDVNCVLFQTMPLSLTDSTTIEKLRAICLDHAKLGESSLSPSLDSLFFGPSASQVLYLTEVSFLFLVFIFGFSSCLNLILDVLL